MKNLEDYITWTRINNDINGNPRYVCHFLNFKPLNHKGPFNYTGALQIAKELGGKRHHTKAYGGGVVFQSYNLRDTSERILLVTGDAVTYHRGPTAYDIKRGYGSTHYRTFLKKDVLNRKGELKKWFKIEEMGLSVNYSR